MTPYRGEGRHVAEMTGDEVAQVVAAHVAAKAGLRWPSYRIHMRTESGPDDAGQFGIRRVVVTLEPT